MGTNIMVNGYNDGTDWRLGALDHDARTSIADGSAPLPRGGPFLTATELDWKLATHLGRDGRASLTDLSETCGASISTVRRRLKLLLEGAGYGCDVTWPPD